MIIFLLRAILLILFWPLALLIAIGWLALLIVRLGFGLTVFAIRAVGVGGAMAAASMFSNYRSADDHHPVMPLIERFSAGHNLCRPLGVRSPRAWCDRIVL
jgi:hypothetical protein